ncbi:MAG: ATP-binding protein [Bacteroidales bacterium]|nr:ATP-binding protein [Bacteroidales bacterium]
MSRYIKLKDEEKYISSLIHQGEHQRLDFKQEIDDARKIARAMAAFANANGGTLLIGVKDNGVISGIRTEEELYMLQAAAEYYAKPKIQYTIKWWQVGGKNILEAIIAESKIKPHYVQNEKGKWTVYVRVNDQNVIAESIWIHIIKTAKKQNIKNIQIKAEELKVLSLFKTNEELSYNTIVRMSFLPHTIVKNVITRLVSIQILDVKLSIKGTYFRVRNIDEYQKIISRKISE